MTWDYDDVTCCKLAMTIIAEHENRKWISLGFLSLKGTSQGPNCEPNVGHNVNILHSTVVTVLYLFVALSLLAISKHDTVSYPCFGYVPERSLPKRPFQKRS